MSSVMTINPTFKNLGSGSVLQFQTGDLNMLMEEQLIDRFDFYQSCFGVYSYMRLNSEKKHVIHHLEALPFVWQPHKSCTIDPLGNISMSSDKEVTPCKATALSKYCYDDMFGSCFREFLEWNNSATVQLSARGRQLTAQITKKILQSFILGARTTLIAGQIYNLADLDDMYVDNMGKDIKTLFQKTLGTCKGVIEALKGKAKQAGFSHLDRTDVISADDFDGKRYTGDILGVASRLRSGASYELTAIMDEGGFSTLQGVSTTPMYLFSTHLFKAVVDAYDKQCETVYCLNPDIRKEEKEWRGRTYNVYYIKGVPVIPIHDLNCFDRYLKGATHFAALTTSGNICLGASFRNLPTLSDSGMAVRIKISEENEDLGATSIRSDALFSNLIANTDLITAQCLHTQPK